MKLGILGGAFDPPHDGHLALARGAIRHFELDRLAVLVSEHPGHKEVELDPHIRLRLASAAFSEIPEAKVELDPHPFTIDLLAGEKRFRDAVFVLGADEFAAFLSWKEPERVLEAVRVAVGTRPGFSGEALERVLWQLPNRARVELFEIAPVAASSTEVRLRIAHGEPIDDLVPPNVATLVRELGLYRHG